MALASTPCCRRAATNAGASPPVSEREDHDVGLNGIEVDLDRGALRNGAGKQSCIGVIFGEASRHLFQRDETGGCENPGLPHAAAESFAVARELA